MKYAVSLDHLIWVDADTKADARYQARKQIAEMDNVDLSDLDFSVVDVMPEDDW